MKRLPLFVLILFLSISLLGCSDGEIRPNSKEKIENGENDKAAVTSLVEDFGSKLQKVSLLAPSDIVKKSMEENYSGLVSPELLEVWQNDPLNAPGRLTSSPWPDRIEVQSVEKIEDAYEVKGEIIEITSEEKVNGGIAAKRPITLVVKKVGNIWLIDNVTLGVYEGNNSIVYKNTRYGFSFSLPETWKGFSIITDKWEGFAVQGSQNQEVVETGVLISIRHPQWTSEDPWQDIPIMVFTHTQWDALKRGDYHIGAAPIGPKELGRNTKYVFALPARYNFAFPTGHQEVEDILQSNPLSPNEEIDSDNQ